MKTASLGMSTVTAILPEAYTASVSAAVTERPGSAAFVWDARGTLLREQWYESVLPSISPAKTMLQVLVPDYEVQRVIATIVEVGKLDKQATGAVFCTGAQDVAFGSDFHQWPEESAQGQDEAPHNLAENLDIIYCIVRTVAHRGHHQGCGSRRCTRSGGVSRGRSWFARPPRVAAHHQAAHQGGCHGARRLQRRRHDFCRNGQGGTAPPAGARLHVSHAGRYGHVQPAEPRCPCASRRQHAAGD